MVEMLSVNEVLPRLFFWVFWVQGFVLCSSDNEEHCPEIGAASCLFSSAFGEKRTGRLG